MRLSEDRDIFQALGTIMKASSPLGHSYVQEIRHADVCAVVVTSVDEGKVGNSTGIMPLMSIL